MYRNTLGYFMDINKVTFLGFTFFLLLYVQRKNTYKLKSITEKNADLPT